MHQLVFFFSLDHFLLLPVLDILDKMSSSSATIIITTNTFISRRHRFHWFCLLREKMLPLCGLSVCMFICTLLKPLDGMRCNLAGTLVWSKVTLYETGARSPMGRGDLGVGTPVHSDAAYC